MRVLGFGDKLKSGGSKTVSVAKNIGSDSVGAAKTIGMGIKSADSFHQRILTSDTENFREKAKNIVLKYTFVGAFVKFIQYTLIILSALVFFGLIVLTIFFFFRLGTTGTGDYLVKHGQTYIADTGAPIIAKTGLGSIWQFIVHPNKPIVESSFDVANEDTTQRYVKIDSPEPLKKLYISGDKDIVVNVAGTAYNLAKDSEGRPLCILDDYDGAIESRGTVYLSSEKEEDPFQFACVFVDGIKLKNDLLTDTALTTYRGKAGIAYSANAESEWKVWLIHSSWKRSDIKDFIEGDPYFNKRTGKSQSVPVGNTPMKVGFSINEDQPFTEEQEYLLSVGVTKDDLYGNLDTLQDIYVYAPSSVHFSDDVRNCDFVPAAENFNYTFLPEDQVYHLRTEVLKYYNKDCSKKGLVGTAMNPDDCVRTFKDEIITTCMVQFATDETQDKPSFIGLRASAEYTYDVLKPFTISVVHNVGEAKFVCTGDSAQTCTANGCRFISGQCQPCPDTIRSCEDYSGLDSCSADSCHFGCSFEGGTCKDKV